MELMEIKDKFIKITEEINPETTIDDLIENILFVYKVQIGAKQTEEGNYITHEELKEQIKTWKK
jgi:hypothetical protein